MTALSLRRFRNLAPHDLEIPREGVALVGENAQGKSNFLEAIYYLETLRSFRGARDDQLVAFGEEVFRVVGTASCAGSRREVAAAWQRTGRRRRVTIDGEEPERMIDAIGHMAAVLFSPADVAIVSGGPAERRRFLDIVLSLNLDGYVEALSEYRHVLAQRNATLKERDAERTLHLWTEPLIRAGARIVFERHRWVTDTADALARYSSEISGGEAARQRYVPNFEIPEAPTHEGVADAFREALSEAVTNDLRLRTTTVGPHRDEVRFHLGDEREVDLREFGSGGQQRTVALALRLIEADTIRRRRGHEPIVLMDDVFAELDRGRSERIMRLIDGEDTGQVILTAPRESDVRLRADALPRWSIAAGRITA
ncbi:MAG: DNA replication and repair protein RecF [Longimicrobiales bacterium]|nr:DNA replication and repair protein RecF [Longimicrobiales bacterium]